MKLNCPCCNGRCGPSGGHNCADCKYLDVQHSDEVRVNFDGVKAVKSVISKKYYCGRKILTCICCDGHCGPTDGCNCKACKWLDIQSDANAILNQDSVRAVKDKNGRFYCGRNTAKCDCCPSGGWCGPGYGYCNCAACGWLSDKSEVFAQKVEDPTETLKGFLGLRLHEELPLDVVKAIPGIGNVFVKKLGDKSKLGDVTVGDLVLYMDVGGAIGGFNYVK